MFDKQLAPARNNIAVGSNMPSRLLKIVLTPKNRLTLNNISY